MLMKERQIRHISMSWVAVCGVVAVLVAVLIEILSRYLANHELISQAFAHMMTFVSVFIFMAPPLYLVIYSNRGWPTRLCIGGGTFLLAGYHCACAFQHAYPGMLASDGIVFVMIKPLTLIMGSGLIFMALYFALVNVVNIQADLQQKSQRLMQEIAERKHADAALKDTEEKLQQAAKMESIGRLAGGIAHDFNNLLAPILGYSELLACQIDKDDPRRKEAEEIMRAATHARELTRQLLAFSRKQRLDMQTVDINRVIMDFQNILKRTIREDIHIEMQLSAALLPIRADVSQVQQILMNLAINAQNAMPQRGRIIIETRVVPAVEITTLPDTEIAPEAYVSLSVSDTGVGMDTYTQEHAFEPFFTTKDNGKGTGLGLAMVHGIVEQHGGAISMESVPESGTAFRILFPALRREAAVTLPKPELDAELARGTETIAVVEDDPDVLELVSAMLRRLGYTVHPLQNPEHAVEHFRKLTEPISLLLTDVVMPNLNGFELAQQLRAETSEMKILYMSGYSGDAVEKHGISIKNIDYLGKPFTFQQLATKVRATLDQ